MTPYPVKQIYFPQAEAPATGQNRLQFYVDRGQGRVTPLVALDELPADVRLQGLPRVLTADEACLMGMSDVFSGSRSQQLHTPSTSTSPALSASTSSMAPTSPVSSPPNREPGSLSLAAWKPTPAHPNSELATKEPFCCSRNQEGCQDSLPIVKETASDKQCASVARSDLFQGPITTKFVKLPPSGVEPDHSAKRYCSFWISRGECHFSQQGCRYMHYMPHDPVEMLSCGFRKYPEWWQQFLRERSAEALAWIKAHERFERERSTHGPSDPPMVPITISQVSIPIRLRGTHPQRSRRPQNLRVRPAVPKALPSSSNIARPVLDNREVSNSSDQTSRAAPGMEASRHAEATVSESVSKQKPAPKRRSQKRRSTDSLALANSIDAGLNRAHPALIPAARSSQSIASASSSDDANSSSEDSSDKGAELDTVSHQISAVRDLAALDDPDRYSVHSSSMPRTVPAGDSERTLSNTENDVSLTALSGSMYASHAESGTVHPAHAAGSDSVAAALKLDDVIRSAFSHVIDRKQEESRQKFRSTDVDSAATSNLQQIPAMSELSAGNATHLSTRTLQTVGSPAQKAMGSHISPSPPASNPDRYNKTKPPRRLSESRSKSSKALDTTRANTHPALIPDLSNGGDAVVHRKSRGPVENGPSTAGNAKKKGKRPQSRIQSGSQPRAALPAVQGFDIVEVRKLVQEILQGSLAGPPHANGGA